MTILGTILPNSKNQFTDLNGVPLVGGNVYFYIPNTSTPKNTWQDPGETILNTNPIILDSRGQAIIYGTGQYRQVVTDAAGNIIWDQLTNDTLPTILPTFQGALAVLDSDQSIADGISDGTNIIFTSVDYDTTSFWSVGSPTRLTVPTGITLVRLSSNVQFANNTTGGRTSQINKNGMGAVYNGRGGAAASAYLAGGGGFSLNCVTSIINVSQGDYFEFNVAQNSGGSLAAQGGRTWMSIEVIN